MKTHKVRVLKSKIWIFLLAAILSPILVLCGFGIVAIFKFGYSVPFALFLLFITAVISLIGWRLKRQIHQQHDADLFDTQGFVEPSGEWSDQELAIWQTANAQIQEILEHHPDWPSIQMHAFGLSTEIAKAFGKRPFDFSAPEALMLLEEISRRYRGVLKAHIPAVDRIRVGQLKWLYELNEKYGEHATKTGKTLMNAWRLVRMINPASGVISEVRGKILDSLFDELTDNLQNNAKRALLQEVAAVCIDLYSGRFSIEETNIKATPKSTEDGVQKALPLEPIRIVMIGQVSSGKSSLINALKDDFVAEVDALPSTDKLTSYVFRQGDEEVCRLIDLPGLEGDIAIQKQLLNEMVEADLILWVVKANQSSRALDCQLKAEFDAYYDKKTHISRKKPLVIGVINQVDRLNPSQEWSPPYQWQTPETPKAKIIRDALIYNQTQLKFDEAYPLSIAKDKPHFGLETIQTAITTHIVDAKNTQRNRQRHHSGVEFSLWEEGKTLFRSAKVVTKNLWRQN